MMKMKNLLFPFVLLLIVTACSEESPLGDSNSDKEGFMQENPVQENPVQDNIPYKVETLAEGLNVPWDMDIADDGRIFFTERPGSIRVIDNGKLVTDPVIRFDEPFQSIGEGGLLGLVLDPQFEETKYIYVYHTYETEGEFRNRVLRLKEQNNRASVDRVLIDGLVGAQNHNGGRIKIGPDGYLYITVGDRYQPQLAQQERSLGGKILRIGLDGSIPVDNPIHGSTVYSFGHRNPQGLAWHPDTKQLYASEHGQTAHDEVNRIEPGANYGWPLIQGDETSNEQPELITPVLHSGEETWAPSGMTFVSDGPWKGQLLVANLRGNQVMKLSLRTDGTDVGNIEFIFQEWGRLRNVYEGPDGSLYIMTNNRDGRGRPGQGDDKLIRLMPNQ